MRRCEGRPANRGMHRYHILILAWPMNVNIKHSVALFPLFSTFATIDGCGNSLQYVWWISRNRFITCHPRKPIN